MISFDYFPNSFSAVKECPAGRPLLMTNWIKRVGKGEREDAIARRKTRRREFSLILRVFLRVFTLAFEFLSV
jgi:hypothetical protein